MQSKIASVPPSICQSGRQSRPGVCSECKCETDTWEMSQTVRTAACYRLGSWEPQRQCERADVVVSLDSVCRQRAKHEPRCRNLALVCFHQLHMHVRHGEATRYNGVGTNVMQQHMHLIRAMKSESVWRQAVPFCGNAEAAASREIAAATRVHVSHDSHTRSGIRWRSRVDNYQLRTPFAVQ